MAPSVETQRSDTPGTDTQAVESDALDSDVRRASNEDAAPVLAAVRQALVGVAGDLSLDAVLEQLVCAARRLVGAQYAALGIPDDDGGFARFITDGMDDELIESLGPLPRTHGLLGAMLTSPEPYRTHDIRTDPRFRGWWPPTHPEMRSFLGYPIVFGEEIVGAFYLTDKVGADEFDARDERLVGEFALHAGVLVELARLYGQSRELSVAGERDRIARELHDSLTQTLFGTRLALRTATAALHEQPDEPDAVPVSPAREHLDRAVRLLDRAFDELRALVWDLRPPELDVDRLAGTIRKRLSLVERTSDLHVELRVEGDSDVLDVDREHQLYRIVQEAVTNAVRHAGAGTLMVSIVNRERDGGTAGRSLRVEVTDDGAGFDPDRRAIRSRRLGLTSMYERATAIGGYLSIDSSPGRGTTVGVEVPLD